MTFYGVLFFKNIIFLVLTKSSLILSRITSYNVCYTKLLRYNTNRVNEEGRSAVQGALMELLLNALEHGNCQIGYDEKTAWLAKGKNMLDLIAIKSSLPEVQKRKVYISYDITNARTRISVRDDGEGFDWRSRLAGDLEAGLHGMGIKLAESFVSRIAYNEKGNEASFEIPIMKNATNSIPVIMKEQKIRRNNFV